RALVEQRHGRGGARSASRGRGRGGGGDLVGEENRAQLAGKEQRRGGLSGETDEGDLRRSGVDQLITGHRQRAEVRGDGRHVRGEPVETREADVGRQRGEPVREVQTAEAGEVEVKKVHSADGG